MPHTRDLIPSFLDVTGPGMRHDGKVRLVLPLLVLVDLSDVVVADEGGEDLGKLDLGDVLPGARIVSGAKLNL